MPKISVIIPIYNCESIIEDTINELLKQTLVDFELICIDDGSTDETWNRLKQLARFDVRIKIHRKENGGAGSARNKAMEMVSGEYVAFLDADDRLYSYDTLKILYENANHNKADICGGKMISRCFGKDTMITSTVFPKSGYIEFKDNQTCSNFSRFIYRSEFLTNNEIHFPEVIIFEDPIFLVQELLTAGKYYYVDEIVYVYYLNHQGSVEMTVQQVCSCLDGIAELLELSARKQLCYLHRECFMLVSNQWDSQIERLLSCDDIGLYKRLIKVDAAVDFECLRRANYMINDNYVLPALEFIWSTSKRYIRIRNNKVMKAVLAFKKL